jgi:anti-sigma B factor antagonist
MFEATVQSENRSFGEVVIKIQGSLDSSSFLDFYDFLHQLEQNGFSKFILNLQDLEFLSSAGISVLIRLKRKLQEKDSTIVLIHLQPEVKELFRFFGFQKTFLIANDKESAEKLLESVYFLKKQETNSEKIISNRFAILEEEQTQVNEKSNSNDVISFEPVSHEFQTSPELEEINFVEEITTEPFLEKEVENSDYEITIPFITKSDEQTAKLPVSILEQSFGRTLESFQEIQINCGKCGTKMRILSEGIHRCPSCKSRFSVRQSGSISTIERLL